MEKRNPLGAAGLDNTSCGTERFDTYDNELNETCNFPEFASCIDPHESIIHIFIGDKARYYAELNYRWGGDANCCALNAGVNPKEYSFPVKEKYVVIENYGCSDVWIATLIEEVLKQGALRVYAVLSGELVVRNGSNKRTRLAA